MTTPQIDDPLELMIESLAYRGAGVARNAGQVVFVQETCPGERVLARVIRVHARFLEAEVETVLESAACRITPCCRISGPDGETVRVPGCVYDHLAYPAEVAAKQRQYADFLFRQAEVEQDGALPGEPHASPVERHYRNKIVLHAGFDGTRLGLGYRRSDARSVVDLPACPLAIPEINAALHEFRQGPHFPQSLRPDTDLTLRWTPSDGPSLWEGRPPRHAPPLCETTAVGMLEVPRDGFSQINPAVAALLTNRISEIIRAVDPSSLIDLYCGVGVFAFAAAQAGVSRVLGVETGRSAVAAAKRNATRLGLSAEFACLPAEEGLHAAIKELGEGAQPVVIVDPPRAGLDASVLRSLLQYSPPTLLYVSCAPDTLARDLRKLVREGPYRVATAELFDMFPRTAHFETLTVLQLR